MIGNFQFIENTINRLNEFSNDDDYDEYVDYDADNFVRIKSRKETMKKNCEKNYIHVLNPKWSKSFKASKKIFPY